jgi:hypothetical protein
MLCAAADATLAADDAVSFNRLKNDMARDTARSAAQLQLAGAVPATKSIMQQHCVFADCSGYGKPLVFGTAPNSCREAADAFAMNASDHQEVLRR